MSKKILFVVTGARHWTLADGTEHPTGFWAEELVTPYRAFHRGRLRRRLRYAGRSARPADQASLSADVNGGQEQADEIAGVLESLTGPEDPVEARGCRAGRLRGGVLSRWARSDGGSSRGRGFGAAAGRDTAVRSAAGHRLPRPGGAVGDGVRWPLAVCRLPADVVHQRRRAAGGPGRQGQVVARRSPVPARHRVRGRRAMAGPRVVDRNLYTGQNPASSGPLSRQILEALQR